MVSVSKGNIIRTEHIFHYCGHQVYMFQVFAMSRAFQRIKEHVVWTTYAKFMRAQNFICR
jgi:hypothetical protein